MMYKGERERVIKGRSENIVAKYLGWDLINELEKSYGKYLYLPFDVPIIKPKDPEYFVNWWFENAGVAEKIRGNFANPGGIGRRHFVSINSDNVQTEAWTKTYIPDIWERFPELKEQVLEYLPFTYLGEWRMWSSRDRVMGHRDDHELIDFPCCMRVKLYDENPQETLWLSEDDQGWHEPWDRKHVLPKLIDTNSFAFNNVRTIHGSYYDSNYKKILWIIVFTDNLHVNRYVDLVERSVKKYKDIIIVDQRPREYYYDV